MHNILMVDHFDLENVLVYFGYILYDMQWTHTRKQSSATIACSRNALVNALFQYILIYMYWVCAYEIRVVWTTCLYATFIILVYAMWCGIIIYIVIHMEKALIFVVFGCSL